VPAVVAAGMAVVTATEGPVPAAAAVPDTDGPVPAVVAAGVAVVPATDGPVPAVATVPAVVAAGMAVVTNNWHWTISIWHRSDGWYWTLIGWNDCRRSHNIYLYYNFHHRR
jgi:hypothetical protein